jgi:sigma-B regulation protein RsbU (phosphoserine phosphatase)
MSAGPDETILETRFDARSEKLQDVRHQIRERLSVEGIAEACVDDIVLAVDEACQNVIRHCYEGGEGDIVLEIRRREGALEIWLTDFGPAVDPETVKPRELGELRPGGLGTHFIQELMDESGFVEPPEGCGNRLRMLKRLP